MKLNIFLRINAEDVGAADRSAVVADFPDDVDCAAAVTGSGFIRRNESKHEGGRASSQMEGESRGNITSHLTASLATSLHLSFTQIYRKERVNPASVHDFSSQESRNLVATLIPSSIKSSLGSQ